MNKFSKTNYKGCPLEVSDFRRIGNMYGKIEFFSGAIATIAYPFAVLPNTICLPDGRERMKHEYLPISEVFEEIHHVRKGKLLLASRNAFGEKLLSTGMGFVPWRATAKFLNSDYE